MKSDQHDHIVLRRRRVAAVSIAIPFSGFTTADRSHAYGYLTADQADDLALQLIRDAHNARNR